MIQSAEEFVKLRETDNPDEYYRAGHEEATIETWQAVIRQFPNMKKWVVYNKTIPLEILQSLIYDEDVDVRFNIAMKNKISVEMIEILSDDQDESVRNRVIYHKKIPIFILKKLTNDPSKFVRDNAKSKLTELGL